MFPNKASNGCSNISGKQIAHYRKQMQKSQRELADSLQILGLDIELVYFAKALNVSYETLLQEA